MTRRGEPEEPLHGRLRALRIDPPAEPFRRQLQERLAAVRPSNSLLRKLAFLLPRQQWAWPAGGVLAGVATFMILTAVEPGPKTTNRQTATAPTAGTTSAREVLPTFVIPARKIAVIQLAFSADVAVEDVVFEVTLPEGLEFWTNGRVLSDRSFRWPGNLQRGENLFPVAVRSGRPGLYSVKARAEVNGETVEYKVLLDVRQS